jgi:hypothetical protein
MVMRGLRTTSSTRSPPELEKLVERAALAAGNHASCPTHGTLGKTAALVAQARRAAFTGEGDWRQAKGAAPATTDELPEETIRRSREGR